LKNRSTACDLVDFVEIRKGTLQMFGLVVLREEFWVKDDLQRSIECLGSTSMFNSLKFCIICSSCFFEPTVCLIHWNFVLYVPHVSLNLQYGVFTEILFYMFLMFLWTYCMFNSLKFCFTCSSCFFEPILYVLFTEILF